MLSLKITYAQVLVTNCPEEAVEKVMLVNIHFPFKRQEYSEKMWSPLDSSEHKSMGKLEFPTYVHLAYIFFTPTWDISMWWEWECSQSYK